MSLSKSILTMIAIMAWSCSEDEHRMQSAGIAYKNSKVSQDANAIPVEEPAPVAQPAESPALPLEPVSEENFTLSCKSENRIISKAESINIEWDISPGADGFSVSLSSDTGYEGSYQVNSSGVITYTAPDSISQETKIVLTGSLSNGASANCNLTLKADDALGVSDDGLVDGLVGNVYQLNRNTRSLPNFANMTPQSTIVVPNLSVANRSFDLGFPGVPNLYEWFGIQFVGIIKIPSNGSYSFRLNSDDGSNLYINGTKVVDNDGLHSMRAREGNITLTAGQHDIRVDYYQGPADRIGLELYWKAANSGSFTIIPKESLGRKK